RLPTEVEWEKAAAWDPAVGHRRRFPWGSAEPSPALANVGGGALRPAPVGAYPAGASAYGAEQLMGDVWEWTSSPFRPWPGSRPGPPTPTAGGSPSACPAARSPPAGARPARCGATPPSPRSRP